MVVFLNPYCSYGRGFARWQSIESDLRSRLSPFTIEVMNSPEILYARVSQLLKAGETAFIAAGGDGTVNLLLNALMQAGASGCNVCLGAIGLGSSNDYHKPFGEREMVRNIPVRINTHSALASDILRINYLESENHHKINYCSNNASIGITAEANALFNEQPGFVKVMRKYSINLAIAVTAIKTILTYRNIPCRIAADGKGSDAVMTTNIGVVKNPYFAGSLSYEPVVRHGDGMLGIHVCADMSRLQALKILSRLSQGRFKGYPNTSTWKSNHLIVTSDHLFALEFDGEVVRTNRVEFSVMTQAIRCCQ